MASPEEKARKRKRMRSHIAKDLRTPKYKQRIKDDLERKRKKVREMTHLEFVEEIQKLDHIKGENDTK
jgi:hypothetical protein